ncbi:MAG: hypothetical protein ACJAXJ_001053 [Colwellia sp.]|jgi:hypothetical protein
MKNLLKSTLVVAVAVGLSACGNDDYVAPVEPTIPTTLDLTGSIVKGSLISAKVQIYRASDTAFTTPLTTDPIDVQTDENGDYTATVVDASGNAIVGSLVVNITTDDDTQMRCDAAVACADGTLRGNLIPTSEIAGLSLSTITLATVDASGASVPIDADANTFTTMATDAVLAQVTANPNIKIDTLGASGFAALQKNASVVVGTLLGVDLSTTSVFDIKIVDSTDTDAFTAAATDAGNGASLTNTLTLINSSFAAITGEAGSTISDTINSYVQKVAVVSATAAVAIANEEDVTAALAGNAVAQAAFAAVTGFQTEISDKVAETKAAVEVESNTVIASDDVPTIIADDVLSGIVLDDVPLDSITGATGGTSS